MKKLAIFDLDGTLLYSLEDLADATNYALKKHGFPEHELEKYKYFVGNGVRVLVERAVPENLNCNSDVIEAVLADFNEYYSKHSDDKSNVYEGIIETVEKLHKTGVLLAVVSNKPDVFTKVLISDIFGELFDAVQGSVPELPKKPNPAMALEVMKNFEISPIDTIFIGDTNIDINTGKAAGVETIGCLWGYRTLDELEDAGADFIAEKPADIIKFIS